MRPGSRRAWRLPLFLLLQLRLAGGAAYDRAITTFSPSGDLLQVTYADQAAGRGALATALTNSRDAIVLCATLSHDHGGDDHRLSAATSSHGSSPTTAAKGDHYSPFDVLAVHSKESRKIRSVDEGIYAVFAGLAADGRVLLSTMRRQVQEEKQVLGENPRPSVLAGAVGSLQHRCTRTGGMRPLGVSCLIAAFDEHDSGAPKLIKTEPSGATSEWRGAAVGRKSDKALLDLEGCCDRLGEMGGDDLATSAAAALLRTGVDACEALIMTRREDGTVAEKWLKGSLKEGEVVWEKED